MCYRHTVPFPNYLLPALQTPLRQGRRMAVRYKQTYVIRNIGTYRKPSSQGHTSNSGFEPKFVPYVIPYSICSRCDGIISERFSKFPLPYFNHQLFSEQPQNFYFFLYSNPSPLQIQQSPPQKKFLLKQSHNWVMSVYKNPRVSRVFRIIFFLNFIKTQAQKPAQLHCLHIMLVIAAIGHSKIQRKEKQTPHLDGKKVHAYDL